MYRHGGEMRSLNALMTPAAAAAQRAATLHLSTLTDHQSANVYDVLRAADDDPRPARDRRTTSVQLACSCTDDEYLTPSAAAAAATAAVTGAAATGAASTTATMDGYVRPSYDAALSDSGKYLHIEFC